MERICNVGNRVANRSRDSSADEMLGEAQRGVVAETMPAIQLSVLLFRARNSFYDYFEELRVRPAPFRYRDIGDTDRGRDKGLRRGFGFWLIARAVWSVFTLRPGSARVAGGSTGVGFSARSGFTPSATGSALSARAAGACAAGTAVAAVAAVAACGTGRAALLVGIEPADAADAAGPAFAAIATGGVGRSVAAVTAFTAFAADTGFATGSGLAVAVACVPAGAASAAGPAAAAR